MQRLSDPGTFVKNWLLEAGRRFILKQSGTLELERAGQGALGDGGGHGGADGGDVVDAGRELDKSG